MQLQKKLVSGIVAVGLVGGSVFSVPTPASAEYDRETVIVINVGIGAVIGGVGSAIHAKSGERLRAFLKGAATGAAGGGLIYLGKDVASNFNRTKWVGWPSKVLASAGSSLVENAYRNGPWYDEFSTDLGPLFFTFKPKPGKDEKKFRARVLPSATASLIVTISGGHSFDVVRSLQVGNPVFKSNKKLSGLFSQPFSGRALNNVITIVDGKVSGKDEDSVMAHELVHTYQYRQEMVLTAPLDPLMDKHLSWLKLDLGEAAHYYFEDWVLGRDSTNRKNFFEQEAEMFEK